MDISLFEGPNPADAFSDDSSFVLEADKLERQSDNSVILPDEQFLTKSLFERFGDNLLLTLPDGRTVMVEGYFSGTPPLLLGPDGASGTASLDRTMVEDFLAPMPSFSSSFDVAIASVESLIGDAFAVRTDATRVGLVIGDPIFVGDQLVTDEHGSLSLRLSDDSLLSIGENTRMRMGSDQPHPWDTPAEVSTVLNSLAMLEGEFEYTPSTAPEDVSGSIAVATPTGPVEVELRDQPSYQVSAFSTDSGATMDINHS